MREHTQRSATDIYVYILYTMYSVYTHIYIEAKIREFANIAKICLGFVPRVENSVLRALLVGGEGLWLRDLG